jgi:hypothetical protein
MGEKLAAQGKELAQLRKEARPGVEVHYVEEGVTRVEREGEGEPAAKRQKAAEASAARGHAELRGRLIEVKQVHRRPFVGAFQGRS